MGDLKPYLIEELIEEYDKLVNIYSRYIDKHDYHSDTELHTQQGRVNVLKELLGSK